MKRRFWRACQYISQRVRLACYPSIRVQAWYFHPLELERFVRVDLQVDAVVARDLDRIGQGTHERFVVDQARFEDRVRGKGT